jgi:hypothetical protein
MARSRSQHTTSRTEVTPAPVIPAGQKPAEQPEPAESGRVSLGLRIALLVWAAGFLFLLLELLVDLISALLRGA